MISIVIVTFRSTVVLAECLKKLSTELLKGDEVIVIENSQDSSIVDFTWFKQENFILKINETNVGYSKACNQGIQIADNKRVLLLNPDTVPEAGALDKLRNILMTADNNHLYAVELLNPDGTRQDYYRRFPRVSALIVMFFVSKKHQSLFPSYNHYTYKNDFVTRNSFEQPPGAGLIVPKHAQLDEDFFIYGSDLMLCWDFSRLHNLEVTVLPARFIHLRGQGGTASSPDLADWLRIESALGFTLYFQKSGQRIRKFFWIISFSVLELCGIIRFVLEPNQRIRRMRRLHQFTSKL